MSSHTDFTTLGRLGSANGSLPGTTRRGSRGPGILGLLGGRRRGGGRPTTALPSISLRTAGIIAGALLVGLFLLGTAAQSQLTSPNPLSSQTPSIDPALEVTLATGGTQMAMTGARTLIPGGGSAVGMVEVPKAFAALEDLALVLPNHDVTSVVFSEADMVDMLPLAPVGAMAANGNPEAFEAPRELDGPDYRVLAGDTGIRPATGMARLYMTPGANVLSPVTGTVRSVEQVTVNGLPEWRVDIAPDARPDLHVVVRRLAVALVQEGEWVGIGQNALGQVSRTGVDASEHNPQGNPSIWIGIRPGVGADAIDVNQPAVAPTVADS